MDTNKINQNFVDNLSTSLATTASPTCVRATSDPEQAARLVAGNSPNSPSLCNLSCTQIINSPKHGNYSSTDIGDSLCLDKNDSSKQDPAHIAKNDSPKQGDPSHLTKNDSPNQGDPVHPDKNDSQKQDDPSHLTKNDSSKQDPAHITKNDSLKQGDPEHLIKNDSPNQGNSVHPDKNDSPKQGDPSHLTKNDSANHGDPAHLTKNDSANHDDPAHLTKNDSAKQDDPIYLTKKDSPNQGDPVHLDKNESPNHGDPAHLTKNDSANHGVPAHLTKNDSAKQDDPGYLTKKDSPNLGDPVLLDKNDSPKQGDPAHLMKNDSSTQGIPAHLGDHDTAGDPAYITKNDTANEDNSAYLGKNDSPNQDKTPHQQAMDSLNLRTLHPDSNISSEFGKTKQSDVNDAAAAIEALSNTSTESNVPVLEKIKLDEIPKTKVILQGEDCDTEVSKNELLSDEGFVIVCKPTAHKTAGKNTFSELKKETKSFTLTDRHTRGLEYLGFKKHCEDVFPGLTLQFDKEQNFIMLESETDYCEVVKKEASSFLDKFKKCSWKLDSRQTFLLTECPSKIEWWIDLCYKNSVYCCFDRQVERIKIYAKSENTLQKCREYFDKEMHCKTFYFALDDNQEVESYLKELQRKEQNFYFSRTTDRRVELICLSHFSKKISEDISLHFCLSETGIKYPETLPSNMTQTQNDSDQNRTDNNEVNRQMKSQGYVDTERQLESRTIDVRKKSSQQAIEQGCFGDAVTLFSLSKLEANNESPSSIAEMNHPSAQQLPASVNDGLVQNKIDSTVLLNDDSSKYNNNVNVKKDLESENQHLLNGSHSNEPSMCEEQKSNRLQLTRLEAELISHDEIQKELLLSLNKKEMYVQFHLDEGFLEVKSGDPKTLKDIMAYEIHTEQITSDKDEEALAHSKFSCYLVKKFDPELKRITVVFHRKISEDLLPIINRFKFSRYFCIFPLYTTTYTRSYLAKVAEIIQHQFLFKVDVDVTCDDSHASSQGFNIATLHANSLGFNITTEKTKLEEVKSTVNHLLKAIQIKTEVLKPHDANRLLNSQGQQYLMHLEEKHKCQINVVSSDRHVFMRASCTSGHKLFMMEGTMATADCQILVLPICDGQKIWPSQYKSILEKNFLTTDMGQYSGIKAPPSPCTLSLECNGESKGQTVVVMYVPSRKDRNFNDTIAKACEIMLSEISGKSTIAMPLELSTDISYKESLPVILRVVREHTLKNDNKPFSVFFYVGDQTLQSLKDITECVETLLGKEEKFPPWKTNILPLGPYHRVQIMETNLEKVKADVIVNSTDPELVHKNGAVSKALLKAAGPEMADQCKKLYPGGIGNRIVVPTGGFHLDGIEAIFHIVLPQTWSHKTGREELRNRVRACLMEASIKKYESIAFPALGVGRLEYPPDIVAQTMFTAATDFFLIMPESTVVNVYFVCHPSDKNAVKAFKEEEQRQKKKLQRLEDEQNECEEYLLSLGEYKLLVIRSDALKDPILTDVILSASPSRASTLTDHQRNNSGKFIYVQNQAKFHHVLKNFVDFKQCRSVGISLDTFDDKWYSEILNAVHHEIAEKSNLQFTLFIQDKQKFDVLQKLTGGKCKPIKVEKNRKAENKEGMIHICGPKDEIEQAMIQLKEMQCIPSYQRPVIPKDQPVLPQNVPLPKDSDDETLENTQQIMHDFCRLIIPNRILEPYLHNFSSLTDVHVVPNPTGGATEFHIKCDSIEKAKTGTQDFFQQISDVTEHSSSEESDSFMKEIDCLAYEALEYIFGDKFTSAFSIQSRDINKVTIRIPNIKVKQSLEEKISSLRQEDIPLSSQEMEVLGNSVDLKSENIDVFIKLMHDQNKAILFGCDYTAVTKAKHLILVKCGRTKLTNRGKRQFAAGSGDPICNQIPMSITGATSPGIGFAKDFVTKSSIKISVYKADITQLTVDAIVNAANENLSHGGGVAFAIAKAAGPDLEVEGDEYIRKFGPLKVSDIVKTTAGRLPCKAVLHAVGPRWDDYQNKEECKQALQQTVYNCLRKSHELNYTSLAVTSISSAIFGVPKAICADSYLAALQSFEQYYGRNTNLQHIHFVDISDEMICIIQDTFKDKWDTSVLPNYVQQSFRGDLKLKSGDGIASKSSLVTFGKTEKEPAYQYNFSHLSIIVKQQHISETDADVIVLWQESGRPFEDTTSQQVLKATGKQILAKEMAILKHKLVSGQIEMLTISNDRLIVLPVMTSFIMNTNDVFTLMEKVFNVIDVAKGKSVAISSLPYLARQKEFNSSSKDLEEFTAGLCMAVLNYVKKSEGPVNCIYIYAENVEVFRVMVHMINVKVREYKASSRLLNEVGIKQSYSDPVKRLLPICKICLDEMVNSKALSCEHTFCEECIDHWFKIQKVCPSCKSVQGLLTGNQPVDGKMEIKRQPYFLKGFDSKDCFEIVYSFPHGKQSEEHPNPGKHYSGTSRVAYIPNTEEGRKVLMLLKVAFDRRLVFTVGTSATSGCGDCIIWNGIHHKTNIGGGIQCFGYPDDTYLTRVQQELKDVGVTVRDLSEEQKDFIQHPRQAYK